MNIEKKRWFGYSFFKYALAYHCVQPKNTSELMLTLDSRVASTTFFFLSGKARHNHISHNKKPELCRRESLLLEPNPHGIPELQDAYLHSYGNHISGKCLVKA